VSISRRTRASDRLRPFAREEESLSRSAGSKINDSESLTRPIDPDPSAGRCLIDDSVTHLAGFPGSRRHSTVALPLWYSTNRFHACSMSVTLLGCEHCGSDSPIAHRERVRISFWIHSSAHCATSPRRASGLAMGNTGNFLDILAGESQSRGGRN